MYCLGDMGGFNPNWNHMEDYYPQGIINFGMKDAWEKAPVSFEVCWVLQKWKVHLMGCHWELQLNWEPRYQVLKAAEMGSS